MKLYQTFIPVCITFLILSSCEIENNPVELLSLVASDSIARSGDVVVLACEAQDGDGDKLSYDWESTSGELSVDRDTARWTAPGKSGYYHITCKVGDGVGASDAASIAIRVVGGVIQGVVTNAVNGESVSGITVTIGNNTAITDEEGAYNIYTAIQSGTYQVSAVNDSFCPFDGSFQIPNNFSSSLFTYSFSVSPFPQPGEIRMVLNWGSQPSDLDSHLKTPEIEGQTHHISYANRGNATSAPYATLDVDDTNGFGPETITIKQTFSGNYVYYIHQYSSSGSLQGSGGVIQIYNSPTCDGETIQVPSEGQGRYWYVCDIDGESGDITVVNQIQNSAPSN